MHVRARPRGRREAHRESAGPIAAGARLRRYLRRSGPRDGPAAVRTDWRRSAGRRVHRRHEEEGNASAQPRPAPEGPGMAAGRIRRRRQGGSRSKCTAADGPPARGRPSAVHEAVRRSRPGTPHLAPEGGRTRSDGARAGRTRQPRRVGRRSRAPRQAWRVPPGFPDTARPVRIRRPAVRPLRAGMRAHAPDVRPRDRGRDRKVPGLSSGRGRPRRAVRRVPLR